MKIGRRYLNSGQFIGYAPELYKMINVSSTMINSLRLNVTRATTEFDNDQWYFTKIYLDEILRRELDIKLDSCSELFQSLPGPSLYEFSGDVELRFQGCNMI